MSGGKRGSPCRGVETLPVRAERGLLQLPHSQNGGGAVTCHTHSVPNSQTFPAAARLLKAQRSHQQSGGQSRERAEGRQGWLGCAPRPPPLSPGGPRALTRALGGDDGLGGDAHAAVVHGQLVAGQAVGPGVAVADQHGLAAGAGALAHGLAGLDGLVLEVDGADGRVHGAQEEQQVRAAVGAQQPLELLHGQHGVGLRAVVQVVRHLGHVPGQRLAERDAHGLAGRPLPRRRPPQQQQPGQGQQRQGPPHAGRPDGEQGPSGPSAARGRLRPPGPARPLRAAPAGPASLRPAARPEQRRASPARETGGSPAGRAASAERFGSPPSKNLAGFTY